MSEPYYLKINKSWFYSAGDKFGWTRHGFSPEGVGIRGALLMMHPEMIVEVDHKKYKLKSRLALEFIKEYGTKMKIGNQLLGIIPRSLMVPLQDN